MIATLKNWWQRRKSRQRAAYEELCREAHRRGDFACGECTFEIDARGNIYRAARDLLFYCRYDIPELGGKPRSFKLRHRNQS